MSDQSQAAGAEELTNGSAIGSAGTESETPTTELETAIGSEGEEGGEEELDDLEFAFGKYRVPKKLAESVKDLQSTFTKKTQEFAEFSSKAGELEAREARLVEQSKATEEEIKAKVSLSNIKSRIDEYEKLTDAQWAEMKETNYEAWNEHRQNVLILKEARNDAEKKLSEFDGKRTEAAQADYDQRIQQTQAFAEKLPGWTADLDKQVVAFAIEKGLTPKQITENMSPAFYDLCRLGRIGADLLKRQATAAKAKTADTPAEPLEMVGAKKSPPPTGLDDKLPIDQWMKVREKQLKAKAH